MTASSFVSWRGAHFARPQATHISHRGGAGERVENTLAAFRHAYQVGTEMFELDCQVTKDGQVIVGLIVCGMLSCLKIMDLIILKKVVVAHDDDLERICGVAGKISTTDFKDLPCIRERQNVTFMKDFQLTRPRELR